MLTGPTRKEEGDCKFGPPILSKIPVLKTHLVCEVGHQCMTHQLIVLVTPHVLYNPEREDTSSCNGVENRNPFFLALVANERFPNANLGNTKSKIRNAFSLRMKC